MQQGKFLDDLIAAKPNLAPYRPNAGARERSVRGLRLAVTQ
jgi:hypothetical protein